MMTDDHGDWLHEVKRDKVLDEAECEICVHYRLSAVWNDTLQRMAYKPYCALDDRDLKPCREFVREIGSEG